MDFRNYQIGIFVLFISCCTITLYIPSKVACQDSAPFYQYRETIPYHPDGIVSKPFIGIAAAYTSVTNQTGIPVMDRQQLTISTGLVLTPRLTLLLHGDAFYEDSIRYRFDAALRGYLRNPLTYTGRINPDGPVGTPVFTLGYGALYSGINENSYTTFMSASILWPVSTCWSLTAGYISYDSLMPFISRESSFGIKWYSGAYQVHERYKNPDLPVGQIMVSLESGFSKYGADASFAISIGVSSKLTITAKAMYETLDPPFKLSKTASLGCQIYP